ncbi:DUF2306 domain-containing protein [Planomonospora venezuelensis]|uniref:Putative membrane protein n=1 Tax=Planomonospora venezuelensis TaxID=1999 RepID=A0A841CYA4_PLAVE|nr:DUF2306 domain-containing protein [Planomonospora venezuelensis]MBB5960967.1 putative membrane protein [Planomonospora venezuelensis]GIN01201.1 hypothetical protein Pve01_28590 [Planomonospora venezuelensis]
MPGSTAAKESTARRPHPRSRIGWTWVVLSSLLIAAYSLTSYAQGSLRTLAADDVGLAGAYADAPAAVQALFYAHVVSASLALALGGWQFSHRLRRRFPAAHRNAGRLYLGAVALGSVSSLGMLPFNSAGMVGFFGFGALAVLWAYSALRAYRAIRGGDVAHHRAWMIRNYALTYAGTTLRAWTNVLIMVQEPFAGAGADFGALFANAYNAAPFLCWLPNLVVAEWLIRRRGLPSYRLTPAAPVAAAA